MNRLYTYLLPVVFVLMPVVGGANGEGTATTPQEVFPCMARFDVLDATAAEKYAAALRGIENGDVDTAAETLCALCRDYGEMFVPTPDDERRYVGVRAAVRGLLADNADLRAAYEISILADEGLSRSGARKIHTLARDYPQGALGRAALLQLAQAYYEADRCEDALWAVLRLERICGWDAVPVQGRIIALTCAAKIGGFENLAARFGEADLAAKFRLRGKEIAVGEYVAQIRRALAARTDYPADNPLFAERARAMAFASSSLIMEWSAAMPGGDALPDEPHQTAEARHFVESYPTVAADVLYLRTRTSVYATSLANPGQPLWSAQVEAADEAHAVWTGARSRMRRIFPAVYSGGRVFTLAPAAEPCAIGEEKYRLLRLMCLDAADGKTLWTRGARDGEFFAGAPTVVGGSVFAIMTKLQPGAEDRCYLARLDAATGEEIFSAPISRQQSGKAEGLNLDALSPPAPPLVRDGVVYAATNAGAVAAFDALFGEPLWGLRYDQSNEVAFRPYKNRFERNMNRAVSFAYGPSAMCGGVLLVAPPEADAMLAVEAASGRTLWMLDNARREYACLLGARDGAAYLAGEKCAAFACADGRPLWRERPDAPEFYGRGVLAGDVLLIPGRAEFCAFDATTGERAKSGIEILSGDRAARTAGYFGTILFCGERMITVSKDRITIYNRAKRSSQQ